MTSAAGRSRPAVPADAWAWGTVIVLVLIFAVPLFAHPGKMRDPRNPDPLNYYLHLELARRSIVGYGQFPWWTPYVRGGIPLVGHPRDVSFSPVLIPALLLRPIAAVKVISLGIYLAAALGMFYLTRVALRLTRIASVAASVLFVTATWLPARLVSGNFDEWHLVLFPLLLAFYYRSRLHWRYLVYAAFVLCVTVLDGKYVVAIFGLYLGLIALAEAVAESVRRRGPAVWPLGRLAAMFALGALLATAKIVPMAQLLASGGEGLAPSILETGWVLNLRRFGVSRRDWSNVNFLTDLGDVGTWYLAPLLFFAALVAVPRRMLGWLALVGLSVLMMHSQQVPAWMDVFAWLHRLPVFGTLKFPFKYFNFFVLAGICIGVGHLLTRIARLPRCRYVVPVVLAVLTVGWPFVRHIRINWHLYSAEVKGPPVVREGEFYSLTAFGQRPGEGKERPRLLKDYFFVREGIGVLNWYDPMLLPCHARPRHQVVLDLGRQAEQAEYTYTLDVKPWEAEVYLAGGGAANIHPGTWSPLAFTVDVAEVPLAGDTLIINRNHNRRWQASVGEVIEDPESHLLAVRLPPGATSVRLRYRPTDHYLAAGASVLAFIGCIAALVLDRRRRRRSIPSAESGEAR